MRTFIRFCLGFAILASASAQAQRVAPEWKSVDARPTPQWWSDAKFGIFIHWGVYSVPAFAPKGEYAEWYWERLRAPGDAGSAQDQRIRAETRAFHERKRQRILLDYLIERAANREMSEEERKQVASSYAARLRENALRSQKEQRRKG